MLVIYLQGGPFSFLYRVEEAGPYATRRECLHAAATAKSERPAQVLQTSCVRKRMWRPK